MNKCVDCEFIMREEGVNLNRSFFMVIGVCVCACVYASIDRSRERAEWD
jgi:hypothetical protein